MQIALIGAGSAQFGLGTLGDLMQSKKLYGSTIRLVDIHEKALSTVYNTASAFIEEHKLPFPWRRQPTASKRWQAVM